MSQLFSPLRIGGLTLANRIVIAPMCQYAVTDGVAADWHRAHLGHLAMSGAGLLILEATAVSAEGRISPLDLGLYSDADEAGFAEVMKAVRAAGDMPVAVQLGHAGRKASSRSPFEGGAQIPPDAPDGWACVAPSAGPHGADDAPPVALDEAGLAKVRDDFVRAAERARRLGLAGVELHMAHGYLLHQFLSPLANRRDDDWGGDAERRGRFPLEVFRAVRAALPDDMPVWIRISLTDWAEGGLGAEEATDFCRRLDAEGCAAFHVSSGGLAVDQKIPVGPGYQVHLAEMVKQAVSAPVIAVGLITEPEQAEDIVASGQADAVALARAMLWNPRWPWGAAAALGAEVAAPKQYWRSAPHGVTPPFVGFKHGQR